MLLMIPFLKRDQEASVSAPANVERRKPDDDEAEYDGLEACMEELGAALAAKDFKGAASAFRSAFQLSEIEPHEEGEHI